MNSSIYKIRNHKTGRMSSWDKTGRNQDGQSMPAKTATVLADIKGPGMITHIWFAQNCNFRESLLRFTWDNAKYPSILVPVGDFFCLGNSIVNSFESCFFTASTNNNNQLETCCALNSYLPMPFRERALVELVNEGKRKHGLYFYIDYETCDKLEDDTGYLHAEFRRANPFSGWGPEIKVNTPYANIANKERLAWNNNYVILETKGRGHYIGCNLSVSNFKGTWWGEGDDMIWVDGYKWPPDLHGTGSEDYLNQAWGMQDNAYLRNGSSIYEKHTNTGKDLYGGWDGGYQTSYVFHPENPVHFQKEIKVTIEHGHGNHLANEMSSVAYWYADKPTKIKAPPTVEKRMPIYRDNLGHWMYDKKNQCPSKKIALNAEMKKKKKQWAAQKR